MHFSKGVAPSFDVSLIGTNIAVFMQLIEIKENGFI